VEKIMIGSLVLAGAVAAPAQPVVLAQSSPSPVVAVAPPAPPIVRSSRIVSDVRMTDALVPAVPVRVRVTAGGQQLLNDTFRVNRNAGASYQESRSEAPDTVCPNQRYYGSQERYSLNFNLNLRDDMSNGRPGINISVRWQRPSSLPTCAGEGSREVQLTQTVPLDPGQSVTIQGDAGLEVTVSR
jgi:hypothetical protein